MNAKHKQSSVRPRPSGPAAPQWSWWGIVFSLLFLSRWFLPAEAADRGVTLWLSALTFLAIGFERWYAYRVGAGPRKMHALDWAVAALVGGHLLSAGMILCLGGDRRAAINVAWEWLALWGMFRSLSAAPDGLGRIRPPAACVVLTGFAIAAFGIWQHHVWYRGMAQAVRTQINGDVAAGGDWQEQLGRQLRTLDSTGQQLLLARLTESTEPIGRFALANTLAGVLAVETLLSAALAVAAWRSSRLAGSWWTLCTLLIAYCLALTKSRTAYVGLAVGVLFWGGSQVLKSSPGQQRRLLWGVALCGALLASAGGTLIVNGSLDRQVLTEAPKSLEYRLQYWSATWEMLKDHPVFGVGPGNFRQHYLKYKLPESSEEVLDPHNEFLDVWANGGLLALSGLLAVWGLIGGALWQGMRRVADGPCSESDTPTAPAASPSIPASAVAVATALCVAGGEWLIQGLMDPALLWLLFGWIAVSLAYDWSARNHRFHRVRTIPLSAVAAAWLALSVHLLGAGGVGMVAVMQLWLWLALWLTSKSEHPVSKRLPQSTDQLPAGTGTTPGTGIWISIGWLVAAVACTVTAVVPNSLSESAVEMGRSAFAGAVPISAAKSVLRDAIEADLLAPEPRQTLAQLFMAEWERNPERNSSEFAEAVKWQRRAIACDPAGPNRYRLMGELYWERYRVSSDKADAAAAAQWYAEAARRYPNLPAIQAEYAIAANAAGDDARPIARRALELNELNRQLGHVDKLLSSESVQQLERIAGSFSE